MTEPLPSSEPCLSVVVCSYNGAAKLPNVLEALNAQTAFDQLEVIVVDDGSSDGTADVAARYPWVRLIRHGVNRGLAAARNTGLGTAGASWVAFTDDDCQPADDWAQRLLVHSQRHPDAFAVGGPVSAIPSGGVVNDFLLAKPPLTALELSLVDSAAFTHRLGEYVRRSASTHTDYEERRVASLPGANMMVRRAACLELGGWDETFTFGGEEEELFRRALESGYEVVSVSDALVLHDFDNTVRDLLRRSFLYGIGNERLQAKHGGLPTLYPVPVAVAALASIAFRRPLAVLLALAIPQVVFSGWVRVGCVSRRVRPLLFPYLQTAQETASNVGWVWARVRRLSRGAQNAKTSR